jgi:hypothetical protein
MAKILVADAKMNLRSLKKALIKTKASWKVVEAADGPDAIAKALEPLLGSGHPKQSQLQYINRSRKCPATVASMS